MPARPSAPSPGDRTLRRLAPALVALLALTALLVGPRSAEAEPQRTRAAPSTTCRPYATAADWSRAFRRLGGSWAVADQAASLRLPDGRLLWLFGDTVQGRLVRRDTRLAVRDWRMPHNSMVLTRGTTCAPPRVHTGPRGRSLVPDAPDGDGHWPMSATVDSGRLLVFVSRVQFQGASFHGTGTRLAEVRVRTPRGAPTAPRFLRWHPTPSTGVGERRGVQWGAATERRGGYTYVYGTRLSTEPLVFGKSLHVARVPRGRLHHPRAWRFWDGRAWVPDRRAAVPVKDAVGGVSTTLSVDVVDGRWVAVTKADEFLGDRIVTLTASRPQGPWAETQIATTDTARDLERGDVTYTALGHPEIRLASGRLLVTVCRNNLDAWKILDDVERGRPYFFEAPWPAP